MTQYSFLITFYECELDMLQKAFTHYLELCKQGIKKNDEYSRFVFDSVMIKRLRSELRKKTGGRLVSQWTRARSRRWRRPLRAIWRCANERSQTGRARLSLMRRT